MEATKQKRQYHRIDPSNYELIAFAACTRDRNMANQLGLTKGHFDMFQGYAACYATKPKDWEKKYEGINTKIRDCIQGLIDRGEVSPAYKSGPIPLKKHGKHSKYEVSNPIKEEAPAMVQQKLPLQSAMKNAVETSSCSEQRGTVSINAVDLYNLIKRMVDMRIEDALTLRAAIDKLKVV